LHTQNKAKKILQKQNGSGIKCIKPFPVETCKGFFQLKTEVKMEEKLRKMEVNLMIEIKGLVV
jgi:uracil DNA glycosylase